MRRLPPMNPVLSRELKQRMRGRHTWLVVSVYLTLLALILRWVYVAAADSTRLAGRGFDALGSAAVGRSIFQWLLFFMLFLVCFIVPGLTAAAIAGERERQTLLSLQVTLLRPRSIVAGKLMASLAFVVLLVVASLPLLSVPFLVGGVSVGEVAQGVAMVLATALVLACLALACSAVLRRTQGATVLAYAMTLALVVGTFVMYGAQQIPRATRGERASPWVLAVNPFVATADVVQGRSDSSGFDSPFGPLQSLLRLTSGVAVRGSASSQDFAQVPPPPGVAATAVAPSGQVIAIPAAPAGPRVIVNPQERGRARLAGIPFWTVSILLWAGLGAAALAVAVRRLTLPAAKERA